jgi:N-(2-amino-2-carboxyethyl)-L-glutamate synthase
MFAVRARVKLEELSPRDLRGLVPRIGNTPLEPISLLINGVARTLWLKFEDANPGGSSKDRTALSLFQDLDRRGQLRPNSIIVESTSGNLGISLSWISRANGHRFVAVVDPKITPESLERMQRLGAEIEMVRKPDAGGGYLMARLQRVQELCAESRRFVWTNQYSSPANPAIHFRSTGPEILAQMGGRTDAVFVAASTGGTLAGVGRYLRQNSPGTKVIAVDAAGSVIFGGPPGPRKLTGIGSARNSQFIRRADYDTHMIVADAEAFAFCRFLQDTMNCMLGGSSGAVVAACARYLADHPETKRPVCICPDGGENYRSSIFNDRWLLDNGFQLREKLTSVGVAASAS